MTSKATTASVRSNRPPTAAPAPFTIQERWDAIREPGSEFTEQAFASFCANTNGKRSVLNCAIPFARAQQLTNFELPKGVGLHECIAASGTGRFPTALSDWNYQPQIQAATQLPQLAKLPPQFTALEKLPWFKAPRQTGFDGTDVIRLRDHTELWHSLRPRVLRGMHTTLVYVTPQLGYSLTPHIKLDQAFCFLASLARSRMPAQLFPAKYLYPDGHLGALSEAPAPIFTDMLPATGGLSFPVMDCTPDHNGTLCRYEVSDRYYGYPFSLGFNKRHDVTLRNCELGHMQLADGRLVHARRSENYIYELLDLKLREELKLDSDAFAARTCLRRGTVTYDGLPFQLPVEMQTMVYAVILTHWEMELDRPGDLSSYSLRTRHAAIRGFHYFQRVEPFYSNFMRMIHDLAKTEDFKTYPLATHLTHSWLGGNLRLTNRWSKSERELGPQFLRTYYHQQLDWMACTLNLWNHIAFRRGKSLETQLAAGGMAFHQMRRLLRFDSHLI